MYIYTYRMQENIMYLLCIGMHCADRMDVQFGLGFPIFFMKPIWILYTLYWANNNGEDQTAWMRSLVCAFVVRMQLSQGFSQHAPPVTSQCIYC